MSEWKEYRLGDIVSIASGFAYKGEYIGRGEKFLLGMGCVSFKDKFLLSGAREYAGECADRYYANVGDLVLATRQQSDNLPILGMPAVIPIELAGKKIIIGANLYRVVNNSEFSNKYLYWLLKSPAYIQHIAACKTGTTVSMITKADVENFVFLAPGNEERCRIEETLNSLDDKIDLLHRENATLEALAETLYRHYFIENSNPDWKEGELGSYIKTTSGGTPSRKMSKYYTAGTIDWVKSKELEGSFIFKTEERITKEAVLNSSAKLLPTNSVLIAMYGATVGEYGISSCPMTCNQAICALLPNDNYPYSYLLGWTICKKQDLINLATGAAQQNISQDLIKQQTICTDFELIKTYDNHVKPLFEKVKSNQQQILSLSSQRNTLLPRLMSGEVKVD